MRKPSRALSALAFIVGVAMVCCLAIEFFPLALGEAARG